MKIVINRCYGGYSLSKAAYKRLGLKWNGYGHAYHANRGAPELVKVVENLGERANGNLAQLKVVEIPDDIEYTIQDYDGIEYIAEKHQIWK